MRVKDKPDVIVFDMDGVLVEVSASYREAIRVTVHHFMGEWVSYDLIQDFKNQGGYNNDWLLSHKLITDRGKHVAYQDVVDYFNLVFLGDDNTGGLILHERWLPLDGTLEELAGAAQLAIFTGRAKFEADATLRRFAHSLKFDPIITDDSVANPKPAPDGLLLIKERFNGKHIWYLGDTVDDARSARDAQVPFIGVSTPHNPRHSEIAALLQSEGAITVLSDVNHLPDLLKLGG